MPTRNVVLTERQSNLIDELVRSGKYQNASEVLREGIRLIELREQEHEARLQALRDAVQLGIDDIEAGRYVEFDNPDALGRYLDEIVQDVVRGKPQA